jgi:hypothetical protein
MRNALVVITCAIALAAARPENACAQAARDPVRFGVQVNFGNDSEFGVGGRLRHSLQGLFPAAPLSGIASADIYFPGGGFTWLDLNYNVVYNFRPASAPKVTPYAGAGLNFVRVGGNNVPSASRLGLNILGGMEFRTSARVTPFLELKFVIEGADQFVLTGGIMF